MRKSFVVLFLIAVMGISCVNQKDITYFQPEEGGKDIQQIENKVAELNTLQPGDILGIMVSSLSPEASSMFNPYAGTQISGINQTIQSTAPVQAIGYLIDENGNITLPLAGEVKVSGVTISEATVLVKEKLNKYLEQPTVSIRILNFKISILGEVNRPSVYTVGNERITLPEALGLAGDLTIFARRDNILIIREVNGKKEFGRVDITKRDLFSSPYYYLKTNDIIYVDPGKGRMTSSDRFVQLAPIIISSLTLVTLILGNFFLR